MNIFEKKIKINELTNLRNNLMKEGNVTKEVEVLKELAPLVEEVFGIILSYNSIFSPHLNILY